MARTNNNMTKADRRAHKRQSRAQKKAVETAPSPSLSPSSSVTFYLYSEHSQPSPSPLSTPAPILHGHTAIPTGRPVPNLTNIIATVNLDCRIDLKLLSKHARNIEYNPKRFGAAVVRVRDPRTTALIWANGKMTLTGAKTVELAHYAARKHARIIQKMGFNTKFKDFKVVNVVGTATLPFGIRLEGLVANYHNFAFYEPELFPGFGVSVDYAKVHFSGVYNGKIVLTGAATVDDLYDAWQRFYPILLDYEVAEGSAQFVREAEKAKRHR